MKVIFRDPKYGHQELDLTPEETADFILEKKRLGRVGFVKFSDNQVLEMMERTGILQQLEAKRDQAVTIVPAVGGG